MEVIERGKFKAHRTIIGHYVVNGPGVSNFMVPDECAVPDILFMFENIFNAGRKDKVVEINQALTLVTADEYR